MASGCRFEGVQAELPLKVISKEKINLLARGKEVTIAEKDPEAVPDLVNVVSIYYLVIREDQNGDDVSFPV